MKYIVITLIFALNFIIWKYPLRNVARKIARSKSAITYITGFVFLLIVPYAISLACLKILNLQPEILSNIMVVFVLIFISMATFKDILVNQNS